MALSLFSIVVAVDMGNGIAKNGEIPWYSQEDMRFFRETTMGKKKNAVIMGRVTYESIDAKHRPLEGRYNVVISRTWKQEEHPDIGVYSSLGEALVGLGSNMKSFDEVFIMGGEQIYAEAIRDYMYLCKKIYVTKFKNDYDCDQFFPLDKVTHYPTFQTETKSRDYVRYFYAPRVTHDEQQYLDVIERVKKEGESKPDRTGVGTTSLFGDVHMVFDISERIPFLTTKKLFYESVIKELLFFVSGKTNTKILEDQNVKIWKDNTSRAFLDNRELKHYEEGDMGKGYGFQWRHWGAPYEGCDAKYNGKGLDQLTSVIESIKSDPHGRRHVVTAWNPADMKEIALPPCFLPGTLVLTDEGYISIENVNYDHKLLSHTGTFRKINQIYVTPYGGEICNLKLQYHGRTIKSTPEHPFYAKRDKLGAAEWINAKELTTASFIGFPVNDSSIIPTFDIIKSVNQTLEVEISFTLDKMDYWFLMGYYLGDGWVDWSRPEKHRFYLVFSNTDMELVFPRISRLIHLTEKSNSKWSTGCRTFECSDTLWWTVLKKFGHLAHNKLIPEWVHNAPKNFIKEFINGYIAADGCKTMKNKLISATTVSPHIAFGIQRLYLKLGTIISVRYQEKPKTHVIQGRTVNQRNLYHITKNRTQRHSETFIADGYVWYSVRQNTRENIGNTYVYNFDVEEDHSYTVENLATHNCHILFQFNVSADRKWLDCKVYIRSNDLFLGAPFNIASYSILTYMIAHVTGLRPRRLYYDVGDAHIYNNHKEQIERQIRRTPKPFPRLSFRNSTRIHTIDDFTFDSFIVEGYTSWPAIQANMAV